jgi:ABC-type multidrug transport system ATPase subunit
VLSNTREEFRDVSGDVFYGNAGAKEAQQFRHQIVMNTEDDLHFPTLKVGETLDFASSSKLPGTRPEHLQKRKAYTSDKKESILNSLSIAHTSDTVVGDEYLRGVSGGERKRVSLAEVLASTAPVQCWDNSTRGLDASNALDFAKVLRKSAHEEQKTVVATLYQAGNGIYNQFDKVTVLVDGRQIYYGPTSEAKSYFEDLGFICTPGANVGDYITSVSVPTERQIAPGFEGQVPETADEFAARFRASTVFQRNAAQAVPVTDETMAQEIQDLKYVRTLEKNRSWSSWLSRRKSPYHVSLWRQIAACTKRQYQIIWGDRLTNILNILVLQPSTRQLFDFSQARSTLLPDPTIWPQRHVRSSGVFPWPTYHFQTQTPGIHSACSLCHRQDCDGHPSRHHHNQFVPDHLLLHGGLPAQRREVLHSVGTSGGDVFVLLVLLPNYWSLVSPFRYGFTDCGNLHHGGHSKRSKTSPYYDTWVNYLFGAKAN